MTACALSLSGEYLKVVIKISFSHNLGICCKKRMFLAKISFLLKSGGIVKL